MCPVRYVTMIRSKNPCFDYRKALVGAALEIGVKPAARQFGTTTKTVRKWRDRYQAEGPAGLHDRSRRPHTCPHQTSAADQAAVLAQRRQTPGFGAARLKMEFELPPSVGAISRILRQHGLTRKPKKKYQTKRDLREIKKKYAPFTRFKMDVKYLTDIPHYWPYLLRGFPKYQYTLVEVRVGAVFLAYSDTYGVAESEAVVRRFLKHLARQGVDLTEVLVQTDAGSEFDGTVVRPKGHGFTHTIEQDFGATHRVVPGCPNAQAEAESLHSRIEPEFFDIHDFAGPFDFWCKIATWQNWYNLRRKNSSRDGKAPADTLRELEPSRDLAIFLLPPVHVDILLAAQGGDYLPAHPVLAQGFC
jgi:transposase-like protein